MAEPLARCATLTGFAELARSFGLDPLQLVAEQKLPAACLTNPDLRAPSAAFGRLLERAAQRADIQDFGLRLAQTRSLSDLGAAAFVVRDQPTLHKALDVLIEYTWSLNEALVPRLELVDETAVLRIATMTAPLLPQGAQLVCGILVLAIRRLVGPSWRPREVWLAQPLPSNSALFFRVFGAAPRFGQEIDALIIDRRDLSLAVAGADPAAAKRALRYVEGDVGARPGDPTAVARSLIEALLPTGTCNIARVAAQMGVSRRTLHRQLAAKGATFTELLDQVRRELTHRHLEAGRLSLTEIAERLGYGSLSAFSRWRRKNVQPPES